VSKYTRFVFYKTHYKHTYMSHEEEEEEDNVCAICLETFSSVTATGLDECGHTFHPACIVKWFRSGNVTCPECRGKPNSIMTRTDARSRFEVLAQEAKGASAPALMKTHFKQLTKMKAGVRARKAKRRAIRSNVATLKKHPKVVEFLTKTKQSGRRLDYKDDRKLRKKMYQIGATDYGTGLMAISSTPIIALNDGNLIFTVNSNSNV
jgi:hypothetical protein